MAAALLKFDATRRRTPDRRSRRSPFAEEAGSAKILFFTGVRIERDREPDADAALPRDAED